jgi:hypothetical protein
LERGSKRLLVALPIRVTWWDSEDKANVEMACTYDISRSGARISSPRNADLAGKVISIERGRSRACYRVVWVGEENSRLQGQIGIQAVKNGRVSWDAELRELDAVYEPLRRKVAAVPPQWGTSQENRDRRLSSRISIEGSVELESLRRRCAPMQAALKDLSELGCRIHGERNLSAGIELKVVLNVGSYDLAMKGRVRHMDRDLGTGIEFREVRKGDQQRLQYLLNKLAEQDLEESFQVEAPIDVLTAGAI